VNPAAVNILQQPFVQVALPIIVALTIAAWLQNKRFDDLNRRIDDQNRLIAEFRHDVNQPRTNRGQARHSQRTNYAS